MLDLLRELADQLNRAARGDAWHGPSMREVLDDVTAEEAAAYPIDDAHSIWEIILHVRATCELVLRRARGEEVHLTPDEDWPAVPEVTDANWKRDVRAMFRANEALQAKVRSFDRELLDASLVASPPYTAFVQFIGVTQHDLYHAGQIVLLKKALRGE